MGHKVALENYIAATNTHDFQNVREWLDEKAVYWFSNKTCVTMDEIGQYFENAWKTIKDEVYGATDIHWLVEENNTATCIYTYQYEGYYQNTLVNGSGRATNVFIKNAEGKWKLVHEHLSPLPK